MTGLVLHGVSPAALGAAVALGTAAAVAAFILVLSFGRRDRAILRWAVPLVAVIPPTEVLRMQWRPLGGELDAIGVVAATAYGPVLVTAAALVFGLSRPFARRSLARQPLFWVAVPNAFASVALVAMLLLSGVANAVTPGADATITKTTSAQFAATGATFTGLTNTGEYLALGTATPSTAALTAGSAIPTAGSGAGAHTLQAGSTFLLVRGNGLATTAYYDRSGAFSATAGPVIGTVVGAGGFSLPRGDGTFLLIAGGGSKNVHVIDPTTGAVGSWTTATPSFTLQGAAGAGAGAHAVRRTDGRFIIVHGAGGASAARTAMTSLYTPPVSTTTTTAVAGAGSVAITPASMAAIGVGSVLTVDAAGTPETITVTAATATTFTATFASAHSGTWTITRAESMVAGPPTYASAAFTTSSSTVIAAGSRTVTIAAATGIAVNDRLVVDTGALQETVIVTAVPTTTSFTATFANGHSGTWPISTSATTSVSAGASTVVTPRSMTGIPVGTNLVVDTGAAQETVVVTATAATTFTATFVKAHGTASYPIAIATLVGDGALSLPLTGANAGKWTTLVGGGLVNRTVYDHAANAFSAVGVTAAPTTPVGAGAIAIEYFDQSLTPNALRWLILNGGGSPRHFKYDPAGAIGQTLTSLTVAANPNFNAGTHAMKRGDGTFLVVAGSSTTTRIWAPSTATFSGSGPAVTLAPGPGAHTFQQADGQMVIVLANTTTRTTTNVHDAGFTGTYTSEMINPSIVDFWDQLSWTASAPLPQKDSIRVSVRTGTDATLPTPGGVTAYQDFFPDGVGTGAGLGAITAATAPQGKRYVQVRITLTRPSSASPDAETGVWLGSGSLAYDRSAGIATTALFASTTATTTVAIGAATVTPASMVGIVVGSRLIIDNGVPQETVTVTAVTATTFTATFTKAHGPAAYAIVTAPVSPGSTTVAPASMTGIAIGTVLGIDAGTGQEAVTVTAVAATTFTATFANAHSGAFFIGTTPNVADYSLRFKRAQFLPSIPSTATAGVGFTASMTLKDSAPTQNTVTEYTGTHTIFFSGANNAPDGTAPTLTAGATVQPFGGNTAVTFTAGASPTATLTLYNAVPATSASDAVVPGAGTVTPADMTGIVSGARLLVDTGGNAEYVTVSGTTATTFTATFVNSHGPGTYTIAQQPQVPSANENFTSAATGYYLCSGAAACAAHGAITVVSSPVPVTVSPAAISAAQSTTSVVPATLTQGATATITTTLRDQYRNPINGVTIIYTSSRGATDSITPPSGSFQTGPPSFANGQQLASITSNTIGTAIITVLAGSTSLPSVTVSFTAPPGQAANVTLVKDTHTLLTPANITTSNAQVSAGTVSLTASNASAAAFCSTPAPCGVPTQNASGAGAHTLQGSAGTYLTLNAGGTNTASVYDGKGAFNSYTLRDASNATQPLGAGAHSVLLSAGARVGQFLVVRGGGTNGTTYLDATFPQVPTPLGPSLTGNAGVGAFAVAISGNRYLVVHGGASTGTSIYQTATDTFVAGPTLTASAGAGAHGITRSDGTVMLVLGNATTTTNVFDPGTNGVVTGSSVGVLVGAGGHAAQLTATSWLVVAGNASTATVRFDTTASNPNPFTAGAALLGGSAGPGAHTIQRADGTLLIVRGGGTTGTTTYTTTNAVAAGPATSASVGDGGHAFPQTDHRYVVILGNGSAATNLYDAGWVGTGTYATEYITRPDIDSWNKVAWAAAGTGAVSIQVEVANLNYSTTAILAGVARTVTPVSMAGIAVNSRLVVDSGSLQETITVSAVTATTFNATFASAHGTGSTAWTISTSSTTTVAAGSVAITPGSMQGIGVSTVLVVDTAASQETVTVTAVTATTFTATFTKAHGAASASWPIVIQGQGLLVTSLDALAATNPAALTSTSPNKMARAVVQLTRPVPLASGAAARVWIGSSGSQPTRTQTASPTLTSLSFGYRSALFSLTAPTPQVAGANFSLTVTLKDLVGTTLTPYTGTHTLVFDGASNAPIGTVPTAGGASFGQNTPLTFALGTVAPSAALFAAETAAVGAKETVGAGSPAGGTFTIASGYVIEADRATIVVLAADPSAVESTITASPTSIPDNGSTASAITVTAKDAYRNLSPYRQTSSTTAVTAGAGRIVTPASMTGIAVGSVLVVDAGGLQETVTVTAVTATTFTATFVNAHGTASYPIQVLRGVSIVSDRPASDTLTPGSGSVTAVTAVFGSSFVSTSNGTSTLTATISGGASSIQLNVAITVTTTTGAGVDLRITPVDGSGNPLASVTAGTSFAIKVEVFRAGTLDVNTQYCSGAGGRTCSFAWTFTAGASPDGTLPSKAADTTAVVITGGVLTTSASFTFVCANSGGTLCLTQPSAQTITLQTTQASNGEISIGTTAAIPVTTGAVDAAKSFVMLSPSAAGVNGLVCAAPLSSPCAPTQITVWARVVDQFRNAAAGRSVTFATSRAESGDTLTQACTSCTDAYGYTAAQTLVSTVAGTSQLTATVAGATAIAAAAQATFFDSNVLRINNGTYFGTVLGTDVTKIPLAVVPTDASNKPLIQQSGSTLTSPTVTWAASGVGTGTFTASGTEGCNGTSTDSAAVVASAYAGPTSTHTTCFTALTPGVVTLTPSSPAGSVPTAYSFAVIGYYDITSTAAPSNRIVDAEVDWDGSGFRIRAWKVRP